MGVGREQGDESQRAEDVGDGEHGLGHQGGVPHLPQVAGLTAAVLQRDGDGGSASGSCRCVYACVFICRTENMDR